MESLLVHLPEGEKGQTVKNVLKALGVTFEKTAVKQKKQKEDKPYNPEFVAKIMKSQEEVRDGKAVSIPLDELWK